MSCAFDREKLTGYYDGELGSAEKAEVEHHISACSECLRDLGEIKASALLVKELPRHRAPRSIAEGVSREIAAAGRVHRFDRWRRGLLWGTAAAAALFLAVNVIYFTGPAGRSDEPPVAASRPAEALGTALKAPAAPADGKPARDHGEPADRRRGLEEKQANLKEDAELRAKLQEAAMMDEAARLEQQAHRAKLEGGKREQENKLAMEKERSARPAAEPAPAPAPKPEPPRPAAAEKKAEPAAPAAALPAAPAPSRPGAPPPAKVEPGPGIMEKDKVAGKAGPARKESDEQLRRQALPSAEWTIASLDLSKVRARVDEMCRKWSAPHEAYRAETRGFAGRADQTVTLELTKAQVDELRRELEKQSGVSIVYGSPQDALTARARGGTEAGQKKDVASGAPSLASKVPSAPPAEAPAGAAAKGADLKKVPDPKAEEARKQQAEAEAAKAKEPAAERLLKEQKDREDAAQSKVDLFKQAQQGSGEPRQKVILHFLDLSQPK